MKIERFKKSHKKEIVVGGLILISIVSAITLVTTKAKYRVTQNIKLVNGTVNYKVPDVRTVAIYLNDGNGDIETNNIPTSGYNLNIEKSICKVYDGTTTPKDNNIEIEYTNGKINILGVSKKNTRCYLYFDKKKEPTASETILANITLKDGTPNFANVATTDEGVYSVSDGMYGGTSYYWRGAVTNNYVKFANKCWRIVRINGDGSLRLIYDGSTCHENGTSTSDSIAVTSQVYNASYDNSSYVGWTYSVGNQRPNISFDSNGLITGGTSSNAKTQTESWFNSSITGTNAEKVANGKFCNDRSVGSGTWSATGSTFRYGGYKRTMTDMQPILGCDLGDTYILKVGAIIADEVMYAGGKYEKNNSYYLYNGQSYWTMSPSWWNGDNGSSVRVFNVGSSGYLTDFSYSGVHDSLNLRPVINLKPDITFSSGNGTQSSPYVVS